MMKVFSVVLAAGLALAAAEGISEPPGSKVSVLTYDNFDRFIKRNDLSMVEFYAPWCGHCKEMAPAFREAAAILAEADLPVKVAMGKVDDTDDYNRNLRAGSEDVFNYTSYPTLLVFKKNRVKVATKKHWAHKYQGKRWQYYGGGRETADDFVFYLTALANEKDPFDEERKVRPGFYKEGGKHESTQVVDLEPDGEVGFNTTVLEDPQNSIWIVEFYSDRCPFCNSLAPEYIKAAGKVKKEKGKKIKFGAINSRVYNEVAEAHGVTSWPWIAAFYQGKKMKDMAGLGGWESVYNWAKGVYGDEWKKPPPANRFLEGPWATANQASTECSADPDAEDAECGPESHDEL